MRKFIYVVVLNWFLCSVALATPKGGPGVSSGERIPYDSSVYTDLTTSSAGVFDVSPSGNRTNLYCDIGTDRYLNSDNNTFLGVGVAGAGNATHASGNEGWFNTCMGSRCVYSLTDGAFNTGYGYDALYDVTSGNSNNAFGYESLANITTGGNNIGIGTNSGLGIITGASNIGIGNGAMQGVAGLATGNVSVGNFSLFSSSANCLSNVAIGTNVLRLPTNANYNVCVGSGSCYGAGGTTDINGNVAVGYEAGNTLATGASYNLLLGYQAGDNLTTASRNVILGYNIDASSPSVSDELKIGNYLDGSLAASSPTYRLNIRDAINPQLRLTNTIGIDYTNFTVDTNGDLTIQASGADVIFTNTSDVQYFRSSPIGITLAAVNSARIVNTSASATVPNIIPLTTDSDTGIGHAANDQLSLIAGGVETIRTEVAANKSLIKLNGAIQHALVDVNTATYSLKEEDYYLHVTYTATGTVTITLPTAQATAGRTIVIKDAGNNATTNTLTIATEGAEEIEFSASNYLITNNGGVVTLYSDGTDWFIQ